MTDRELIIKIIQIGVAAYQNNRNSYADPYTDPELKEAGVITVSAWLEDLAKLRLISKVEPRFSSGIARLVYQVTDEAVSLWGDPDKLAERVKTLFPASSPMYDIFFSYAIEDSHIARELSATLEAKGLRCFMAEKDIAVATRWEEQIRLALLASKRILILITPRSKDRPWLLLETGAAWALQKELIPALMHVPVNELIEPIRYYQARVIETQTQINKLVSELVSPNSLA